MQSWRKRAEPWLLKALERTVPDRSVALFEYRLQPRARYGWDQPPHAGLRSILEANEDSYAKTIAGLFDYEDQIRRIPRGRQPDGGLSWDNDYWGGIDAVAQYALLAQRRPSLYLEVGSGYSTMFARRAIQDHELSTRIVSIDPYPRAEIDRLCDEVVRQPLEETDLAIFGELRAGDVLVIDGSHTAFMNSDAVVAFLDILPSVPPGVLVAIDDIFLPWDYPPTWAGRWYGEQYLLAGLLLSGAPGWSVVFPAWYLTQESALRSQLDPLWEHVMPAVGKYAMSFWMERVSVD
jgi:hypothetical protein